MYVSYLMYSTRVYTAGLEDSYIVSETSSGENGFIFCSHFDEQSPYPLHNGFMPQFTHFFHHRKKIINRNNFPFCVAHIKLKISAYKKKVS